MFTYLHEYHAIKSRSHKRVLWKNNSATRATLLETLLVKSMVICPRQPSHCEHHLRSLFSLEWMQWDTLSTNKINNNFMILPFLPLICSENSMWKVNFGVGRIECTSNGARTFHICNGTLALNHFNSSRSPNIIKWIIIGWFKKQRA